MTDKELMQQALDALDSMNGTQFLCDAAHHSKKDRHEIGQPCPVAERYKATRETLRARLAQPEPPCKTGSQCIGGKCERCAEPEPVAWCDHVEQRLLTWRQSFVNRSGDQLALDDFMDKRSIDDLINFVCDEYTSPPQRQWQGLTDEEINDHWINAMWNTEGTRLPIPEFARAIEAALKEKNHG